MGNQVTWQWHIFQMLPDQGSDADQAERFAMLVVSRERINKLLPVVHAVPLIMCPPSLRTAYPNEVVLPAGTCGLNHVAMALCYGLHLRDKQSLTHEIGELVDVHLRQTIIEAIRFQLDLA